MPTILQINPARALDINGYTSPGALATFYDSGTSRPRTVYTDPECTVPHASPVVASGAGVFPPIYDAGSGDAKVLVTDQDGVTLAGYPIDPCVRVTTDQTGASSVAFEPTAEIPETDVQAAIERLQQNIVEPLADFGLGVTGNAAVLASIDATNIASGAYRYNDTTAGTFPSGVTAADAGTVRIWREASGEALMILTGQGGTRQHMRSLTDGAWGSWVYTLRANDTASDSTWSAGTSTTTYAASPAAIRAAAEAVAIGYGQQWQGVLGSRSIGTVYENTTGKPIMVSILSDSGTCEVSPNGSSNWIKVGEPVGDSRQYQSFIVPSGHSYRCRGASNLLGWAELR